MRRLTILGIAAMVAVLSSCATTRLPSMSEMLRDATEQDGRACVDEDDIDGYGVLENNVIGIDGERDYYLATVSAGCDDNLKISVGDDFGNDFDSDDDLVDDSDNDSDTDFGNDSDEICGESGDELDADEDDCEIHQVFEFDDREEALEVFNDVMDARERMGEE
jgi:hypothetical protein